MKTTYYGVYRVFKNGKERYVRRSCTANEGLAREIARDLSNGEVVMPDGSVRRVERHPHVCRPIGGNDASS